MSIAGRFALSQVPLLELTPPSISSSDVLGLCHYWFGLEQVTCQVNLIVGQSGELAIQKVEARQGFS